MFLLLSPRRVESCTATTTPIPNCRSGQTRLFVVTDHAAGHSTVRSSTRIATLTAQPCETGRESNQSSRRRQGRAPPTGRGPVVTPQACALGHWAPLLVPLISVHAHMSLFIAAAGRAGQGRAGGGCEARRPPVVLRGRRAGRWQPARRPGEKWGSAAAAHVWAINDPRIGSSVGIAKHWSWVLL